MDKPMCYQMSWSGDFLCYIIIYNKDNIFPTTTENSTL